MKTTTPQMIYLMSYQPPSYLIHKVDLDFQLHETNTRVIAKLNISPNLKILHRGALELDGENLKLVSLKVNDTLLKQGEYQLKEENLIIHAIPHDQDFILETEVEINPSENTQLMGLYRSSGNYCTQCEAEGFRRITYFLDRPDVMATYRVRLEADKEDTPILLSNGNLIEAGDLDSTRHYAIWEDPHPKPSYLFALVGGNLDFISDKFITKSGLPVDLNIYVEKGKSDQAYYAMDALKRSMKWDEDRFDREYDLSVFNIVAVSDFNMGAMENKGLNIFNDKYVLARPDLATDLDYENIESIIAHEYFHNWTGNRITCRDWFQLCLKEGLTVFRDQEFSADMRSKSVQRIKDVKKLIAAQFSEDAGPLSHPVRPDRYAEINNFYTATVYEKGAELIRMLQTLLGKEGFKQGMDLYFKRHDGDATTIEAFIQCFSDAQKTNLTPFLKWYSQAGTPRVSLTTHFDEDSKTLTLEAKQQTPTHIGQAPKHPVVIPIKTGLLQKQGQERPLADHYSNQSDISIIGDCLIFDKAHGKAVFQNVTRETVLSTFREFSAPVIIEHEQSLENQIHIAMYDKDDFNRWSMLQKIQTDIILKMGRGEQPSETVLASIGDIKQAILNDKNLPPNFQALCIAPPSLGDLIFAQQKDVMPEALSVAREAFNKDNAARIFDILNMKYMTIIAPPSDIHPKAAAKRDLRHSAFAYLLFALSETQQNEKLKTFYDNAQNMTELSLALQLACRFEEETSQYILKDFEKKYAHETLIMDKWLSAQASSSHNSALSIVKSLLDHPHFTLKNPNRVSSLLGGFAFRNLRNFHSLDGSGYQFITEKIGEIDEINPQVAARLLTSFRSWRSLHRNLRELISKHLNLLSEKETLSGDVKDILHRTLKG